MVRQIYRDVDFLGNKSGAVHAETVSMKGSAAASSLFRITIIWCDSGIKMTTQISENEFLMRCSCGDKTEHIAWLIHEPNDSRENNLKAVGDDWYLLAALAPRYSFWQRLSVAFRYLFKLKVGYWGYVELVLRDQDIENLVAFIVRRMNKPQ